MLVLPVVVGVALVHLGHVSGQPIRKVEEVGDHNVLGQVRWSVPFSPWWSERVDCFGHKERAVMRLGGYT